MNAIRDLLHEADPLRVEPEPSAADRSFQRQAILTAAATTSRPATKSRSLIPVYLGVMLITIVAFVVGLRLWAPFIGDVQAAVRFEVRLAEQNPAPGLKEAKDPSGETVYLHNDVIVTNSDIAQAKVIPQPGGSQYAILVTFKPAAARKMHTVTEKNIGKRMAILIDGEIATAPMVREATGELAKIDSYTREEAEKIVAGMKIR
jgi:hypothetical protein